VNGLIVVLVWLVLSVVCLVLTLRGRRFKKTGVVVEALCVGHFTPSASGYAGAVLEYSVDGSGPLRAEVTKHKYPPAAVGQRVEVMVNPQVPGRAILQSERDAKVGLVFYLMSTLVLAIIFVAGLL
jgi:hypothetical protein